MKNIKSNQVPIFMISTIAEEMLAYTNIIPEWLCKQRQENLYIGESLFGHVELIKRRKLQLFPAIHSIDLITSWQEPCIVFAPHWSLRLGPVHLLRRWHADPNSLLVPEQEVDASLALLPFKPLEMKVLQCSFLSGIKTQKIQPLLEILRPKLVLFPKNPRVKLQLSSDSTPYTVLHYSEGETLRVPSLRSDIEVKLATDLAVQLRVVMMNEENLALARLKGKLVIDHGTFRFGSCTRETTGKSSATVDPNQVLSALREKGVDGTMNQDGSVIDVREPGQGSIEMLEKHTVVSADDEILASLLFEVVSSIFV